MNDEQKDDNLTQNPASQSGFVADYTQGEVSSALTESTETVVPSQDESSQSALDNQPEAAQPQDDVSGDSPSAVEPSVLAPQEDVVESQPEPIATAEVSGVDQPEAAVVEEVPGIDVSAGEEEIIGSVDVSGDIGVAGVDEEPAEVEDTLESLSGDI